MVSRERLASTSRFEVCVQILANFKLNERGQNNAVPLASATPAQESTFSEFTKLTKMSKFQNAFIKSKPNETRPLSISKYFRRIPKEFTNVMAFPMAEVYF